MPTCLANSPPATHSQPRDAVVARIAGDTPERHLAAQQARGLGGVLDARDDAVVRPVRTEVSITIGTLPSTSKPNRAGSPCEGTRLNTGTVLVTTCGDWVRSRHRRDAHHRARRAEVGFFDERDEVGHRALFDRVRVADQARRQVEAADPSAAPPAGVPARLVEDQRRRELERVRAGLRRRRAVFVERRQFIACHAERRRLRR